MVEEKQTSGVCSLSLFPESEFSDKAGESRTPFTFFVTCVKSLTLDSQIKIVGHSEHVWGSGHTAELCVEPRTVKVRLVIAQ